MVSIVFFSSLACAPSTNLQMPNSHIPPQKQSYHEFQPMSTHTQHHAHSLTSYLSVPLPAPHTKSPALHPFQGVSNPASFSAYLQTASSPALFFAIAAYLLCLSILVKTVRRSIAVSSHTTKGTGQEFGAGKLCKKQTTPSSATTSGITAQGHVWNNPHCTALGFHVTFRRALALVSEFMVFSRRHFIPWSLNIATCTCPKITFRSWELL